MATVDAAHTPDQEAIVQNQIRAERARQGLTLDQLSKASGVSVPSLSIIERGKRTPRPVTLARIAQALGVPVEDLQEIQQ